jgi:hypothetical protein
MKNLLVRRALLFLASLSLTRCSIPGPSPAGGTGGACLQEACTFGGFQGAGLSDEIIHLGDWYPTAAGGTQTFTARSPTEMILGQGAPYARDFTAATTDPSIATVESVTPPTLVLRGHVAGSTRVQLFEPETHLLLGEETVEVEPIAEVSVIPDDLVLTAALDAPAGSSPAVALLAGGTTALAVRLVAASGNRLVDESMTAASPASSVSFDAWDDVKVEVPPQGAISFSIVAGGSAFSVTTDVVAAVDDVIVLVPKSPPDPIPVSADAVSMVCCAATSNGALVGSVTWTAAASPGVAVPSSALGALGCFQLEPMTPGAATLTVDASGLTKTFDLTIAAR